jgi:hypothetical protein
MFDRRLLSDVQVAALLPALVTTLQDQLLAMNASQTASVCHALAMLQLEPSPGLWARLHAHMQRFSLGLSCDEATRKHAFSTNQLRSLLHSSMVVDLLQAARLQDMWPTQGLGSAVWHCVHAPSTVRHASHATLQRSDVDVMLAT